MAETSEESVVSPVPQEEAQPEEKKEEFNPAKIKQVCQRLGKLESAAERLIKDIYHRGSVSSMDKSAQRLAELVGVKFKSQQTLMHTAKFNELQKGGKKKS